MSDYNRIKKQIQAEAECYAFFGPGRIFTFVYREIMKQDLEKTIEFMTSKQGGFESEEVKRIIYELNFKNKTELYLGIEAF